MTAQVQAMLQRIIQPSGPVRLSPSIDAALRTVVRDGERDDGPREPLVHSYLADLTQTQLAMLDALPLDRLSGRVRVSVCGESPSARLVALLDLLLLWRNVCRLHADEFPISELVPADIPCASLVPRSDRLMAGYVAGIRERAESTSDVAVADTLRWAEQLWTSDPGEEAADLIIADSGDEEQLGTALDALAPGGLMMVFASGTEPGASWLSGWRRRVLQSDQRLVSLGPCGQEFGNRMPAACEGCWPVRSERVEIPELEIPDDPAQALNPSRYRVLGDRGYLQTSWSYMLIGREGHDQPTVEADDSGSGEYRFVGAFQQSRPVSTMPAPGQPVDLPIYLKICPATNQGQPTVISTDSGTVSPQLGYGDRFDVSPINMVERGGGVVIYPADQQIGPAASEVPDRARTFFPALTSDDSRSALHHGLDELAYRMFGFPGLRGFQHIILERVLTGRSVLGIAATGGGKSECFILPSMILPGITVVVSPLKSLMMDQYQERVNRRYGLGSRATWINGDLSSTQQRERLDRMIRGDYSLIYLTPEQLDKDTTITALAQADRRIGIRYLAIDEAHCISQWGHDFRPAYLSTLRRLSDAGLDPLRIALTATASPQVRADICNELGLTNRPMAENGDVYIYASNRPELNLITRISRDRPSKVSQIADELRDFANDRNGATGSAIVFMPWTQDRKDAPSDATKVTPHVTSMASYLEQELETEVAIYHGRMETNGHGEPDSKAQMNDRERQIEQDAFIHGDRRIMIATKGFGMGIDKPDIRMVIHATPPGNLEAYVQEAGRAGRDGEPSNVVLYYSPDGARSDDWTSDFGIQQNFLENKRIERIDVQGIARYLMIRYRKGQESFDVDSEDLQSYIERYRLDRDELPKTFRPRREETNESPDHAHVLDRGHQYREWSEYLYRVLRELLTFNTMLSQSDRGAFFESVTNRNRASEAAYRELSLPERRERVGASRRAFPNIAQQRAKQAGRQRPNLDDWFGLPDLAWPRGWRVQLGSVFADSKELVEFVKAFCQAHEQRYENARDSYARLLTDYLGLKPDGTINTSATPECLRSVMLGYLKTNEIVQDGNCLSCSNCVPDERFDQYTIEQRRAAVIRIPEHIQRVLDDLEASTESIPDPDQVSTLLEAIRRDSEEARGLERYVAGWSGRILDEQPGHVGIRWLRVELFDSEEEIELHEDEFVGHLRSLLQHLQSNHLQRLWDLFARVRDLAGLSRNPDVVRFHAELAERLGDHSEEAKALQGFQSLAADSTIGADTSAWLYGRIRFLHHPGGPIPDTDRYEEAVLRLARISPDVEMAGAYYRELKQAWRWSEIEPELHTLQLHRTVRVSAVWALLRIWLENDQVSDSERFGMMIDYLSSAPGEVIDRADLNDIRRLVDEIEELPDAAPTLAGKIAGRLIEETNPGEPFDQYSARLVERLFVAGREIPRELSTAFLPRALDPQLTPAMFHQLEDLFPSDRSARQRTAESLSEQLHDLDEQSLRAWLSLFPVELHEQSVAMSQQVVAAISAPPGSIDLLDELKMVAQVALWGDALPQALHRHWISIMRRQPGLLGEYIQDALEAEPPVMELAELAFSRMLEHASPRDFISFLRWARGSEVVRVSTSITDAAHLFELLIQWSTDQQATRKSDSRDASILRVEFEEWCVANHLQAALQMDETHYRTIVEKCIVRVRQNSG